MLIQYVHCEETKGLTDNLAHAHQLKYPSDFTIAPSESSERDHRFEWDSTNQWPKISSCLFREQTDSLITCKQGSVSQVQM